MKEILQKIGFSEKEANIYLALLHLGPSSADAIQRETKIERTHIYKILRQLEEKALLSETTESGRKVFSAHHPHGILAGLQQRTEELRAALPTMERWSPLPSRTNVKIFRGEEGLKALGEAILPTTKSYRVIGEQGLLQRVLPYYSRQFMKKIGTAGIKERILAQSSAKILKSKNSDVRYLPHLDIPSTTVILERAIIIVDWGEPCAVMIENENMATAYGQYFTQLWKRAKKS